MAVPHRILGRLCAGALLYACVCSDYLPVVNPPDPDDTPVIPLVKWGGMVKIPAQDSTFRMGTFGATIDEQPAHTVGFSSDFYIDTTEVTQADYNRLMRQTYATYISPAWDSANGIGPRHPAYQITWFDAVLYCNARSKSEQRDTLYSYAAISGIPGNGCVLSNCSLHAARNGYRLPTEAEWEYVCRAGSTTAYFWGTQSQFATAGRYVWYSLNANEFTWQTPHAPQSGSQPVATLRPNSWGLYDMLGNCAEWVHDFYSISYYAASPPLDPFGPASTEKRVIRGGSWKSNLLTCTSRSTRLPSQRDALTGMRVVRR